MRTIPPPSARYTDHLLHCRMSNCPVFTNDVNEFTKTCSSNKSLARKLLNALQSRVHGPDGKSRDYIFQAIELPEIGLATMTYLIASSFASPRNTSTDGYKNTFNVFCFLPPPANKAYQDHIYACNNNTADEILGQNDHNAAAIKRTPFINGR